MALVSYISNQEAAEKIKPVFEGMEKKIGVGAQRLPGDGPQPGDARSLPGAQRHAAQDPARRQAPRAGLHQDLRAQRCDYCLHHHRALGKKAGLNDRQVAETAEFETSDAYDDLQRDVMRYAEQVTRHINVDDALFARLKKTLNDRADRRAGHDGRDRQLHQSGHRDAEDGAALIRAGNALLNRVVTGALLAGRRDHPGPACKRGRTSRSRGERKLQLVQDKLLTGPAVGQSNLAGTV